MLVHTVDQLPVFYAKINQNTRISIATAVRAVAAEDVALSVTAARSRQAEAATELRIAILTVEVDVFAA